MKSTGIIRRVDELGRIVLPIELRRSMGIEQKDQMEIFVDGENLVLKKYKLSCIFCDKNEDLITFRGKYICRQCANSIQQK